MFVVDRGTAIGTKSSTKQVVENDYVKSVKAVKTTMLSTLIQLHGIYQEAVWNPWRKW